MRDMISALTFTQIGCDWILRSSTALEGNGESVFPLVLIEEADRSGS